MFDAITLEFMHAVHGTKWESYIAFDPFPKIIGVDRLTALTLEARVALEACA